MYNHKVNSLIVGAALLLLGVGETSLPQQTASATKSSPATTDEGSIHQLNQTIQQLNRHVGSLTKELQRFKTDVDEIAALWRVLLMEQRQGQLEDRLASIQQQLFDVANQQLTIRSRLQNLDKEFIPSPSAFITQDQLKRQIRQQLEQQLQQLAAQQPTLMERERELKEQLSKLRSKLEAFKRELEAIEQKRELQKHNEDEQ